MSHWGGDGPPLAPSSDSSHHSLQNDVSFIILSLSIITQQLSAVLASQLSSPLSASSPTSKWLVQALSNISTITYYLSFTPQSTVTPQQSHSTISHSSSPPPSSQVSSLSPRTIATSLLAATTSLSSEPLSSPSSHPPTTTPSPL